MTSVKIECDPNGLTLPHLSFGRHPHLDLVLADIDRHEEIRTNRLQEYNNAGDTRDRIRWPETEVLGTHAESRRSDSLLEN